MNLKRLFVQGCIGLLILFIGMGIILQVEDTDNPFVSKAEASEYEVVPGSDFVRVEQKTSPRSTFHLLHFASSDNVVAVNNLYNYNDGGDIYHSSDGGINFELVRPFAAPIRGTFSFPEENVGYAAGGRSGFGTSMYLGKTEDGGKTWTDLHDNLVKIFDPRVYQVLHNVAAPHKDRVYTVTFNAMYGSRDGGLSWFPVENNQDHYTWSLDVVDGRTYIATHTDFKFLSSGSDNWVTIPAPWYDDAGLELKDLYFETTSRGWALVEDTNPDDRILTLHRTDDGGHSWLKVSSSLRNDLETIFPRNGNLITHEGKLFGVGRVTVDGRTSNHVLISENGGLTWKHDAWNAQYVGLRFVKAAGELRVYSNISGHSLDRYGLYKPGRIEFSDVSSDHTFYTEINALAAAGIVTGYDDDTFKPSNNVTRMATAAFLYRTLGLTDLGLTERTFSDVPTDHHFFEEIEALAASKITTGYADGTFKPSAEVTRMATAAFLYRAFGLTDPGVTVPTFSDVSTTHPFFKEIEALAASGITKGYADGTFRPEDNVTRMAMAAFLYRGLELDD